MNDEIARLEKEVNDLRSRACEIDQRLKERERELDAAKVAELTAEYAAKGIVPGCKVVVVSKKRDREIRTVAGFTGVEISRWGGVRPILTKIRKDGTVGKQPAGIYNYDRLELAPDQ